MVHTSVKIVIRQYAKWTYGKYQFMRYDYEDLVCRYWQGHPEVLGKKPVFVPFVKNPTYTNLELNPNLNFIRTTADFLSRGTANRPIVTEDARYLAIWMEKQQYQLSRHIEENLDADFELNLLTFEESFCDIKQQGKFNRIIWRVVHRNHSSSRSCNFVAPSKVAFKFTAEYLLRYRNFEWPSFI
jgi:hypothetical protein